MSGNEKNKSHRRGKLPSHPIESLSFKSRPGFSSLKLYFYNTSFSFIFIDALPLELNEINSVKPFFVILDILHLVHSFSRLADFPSNIASLFCIATEDKLYVAFL